MPPTPFGKYLRAQRKASRLSQRELAKALGLHNSYVSDVESGARASLNIEHWPALLEALPTATYADLARAAAQSRPLEIDLAKSSQPVADLAVALAVRVRNHGLTDNEALALLDLVQAGGGERVRAFGRVVDPRGEPVPGRAYLYRLSPVRGWTATVGVRGHAGIVAGPIDGRTATFLGTSVDLLRPGDRRGAGFFDVPGGLAPGEYALDVHPANGAPDGPSYWAAPLIVTDGAAAQDVLIVGPTTTPPKIQKPTKPGTPGKPPANPTEPAAPPPPVDVGSLPRVTALAKQFTKATFTAAVSYYGAVGAPLDRVQRDLTRFRAAGFANARIWIDWPENRAPASSAMRSNGSFIEEKAKHLATVLDFMASIGMSADLTMRAAAYDFVKVSGEGYDIPGHKAAVKNVLTRWGKHPALRILDMANEAEALGPSPGSGSPGNGHVSPGRFAELMTAARSVPHTCLVSASVSSGGEFKDVSANYANTNDGHTAGLWRDTKGDIALPHWPRVTGWGAKEGPQAKALSQKLGVPVYNQEPARNGHGGANWPLAEFEASFRSAKANAAVGQCFHTGAGFNLSKKDAWDQLDGTEREVVARVLEWLS